MSNPASRSLVAMAAVCAALACTGARADDADAASATPPPAQTAHAPAGPDEHPWRLGLALGYGARTNPLIQSKDIPVLVDIDVAWFGKRWFFDKGDVGFTALDNRFFTANLTARVNSDRVFFSRTNTKYVQFAYSPGGTTTPLVDIYGAPITAPEPVKPPKRAYAIEAGLEVLFGGEWGNSTLRAFHDVSGTHDGFEISLDYAYRFTRGRFSLSPSAGVSYKDANLSNYYWGVHPAEASSALGEYRVKGGFGWEAGLRTSYYLTKSLRIAISANYESLQHSIAASPLVAQDYVLGYFAGLGWQF